MKKKSTLLIVGSIVLATAIFIGLGFVFQTKDIEKQEGLTDVYDVSSDGTIAYIVYESGKSSLYINDDADEPVVQLPEDMNILDIAFSPDGKILAYVLTDKKMNKHSKSEIHLFTLATRENENFWTADALITELEFYPMDPEFLFYLQAETFENYSPIAGARPHNFDVHSISTKDKAHTKLTNQSSYSMSSLQTSLVDQSFFVSMFGDNETETAEEIFESKQKIFQFWLEDPTELHEVSIPGNTEDVYDFVLLPDRNEIIYQAVSGTDSNGTFIYDLFLFNEKAQTVKKVTHLQEHASKPKRGPDDEIYFMVNRSFAERTPSYQLNRMDIEGNKIEKVKLDHVE